MTSLSISVACRVLCHATDETNPLGWSECGQEEEGGGGGRTPSVGVSAARKRRGASVNRLCIYLRLGCFSVHFIPYSPLPSLFMRPFGIRRIGYVRGNGAAAFSPAYRRPLATHPFVRAAGAVR